MYARQKSLFKLDSRISPLAARGLRNGPRHATTRLHATGRSAFARIQREHYVLEWMY